MIVIIIVVVVLLLVGLWGAYNSLVRKRNRTQEAWSEIDVELKRRHDLIPNLVSTVQGYASHERATFQAVTDARANAVSAGATGDPAKIAPAENALSGALRSLFAVAENYPLLRAVESFTQLQETLTACGVHLFDRTWFYAAIAYSWMRPPSRSCLRIAAADGLAVVGAGCGASGGARPSARCGLWLL